RDREVFAGDDGTLHVPAGAAGAESSAVPGGFTFSLPAPEQRVEGVAFAGGLRIPASLGEEPHLGVVVVVADAAEPGICGEIGVEVGPDPVRRVGLEHLGHTSGDELHALHYADVVGGRQHAERLHIGAEQVGLGFGEFLPGDSVAAARSSNGSSMAVTFCMYTGSPPESRHTRMSVS